MAIFRGIILCNGWSNFTTQKMITELKINKFFATLKIKAFKNNYKKLSDLFLCSQHYFEVFD